MQICQFWFWRAGKFAHLHFWASGKFASFDALSGKLAPHRNYQFLRAALSTPRNDTRTEWAAHQQNCSNCLDTRKDANLQGANLHNWQQKNWQVCTFAPAFLGLLGHYSTIIKVIVRWYFFLVQNQIDKGIWEPVSEWFIDARSETFWYQMMFHGVDGHQLSATILKRLICMVHSTFKICLVLKSCYILFALLILCTNWQVHLMVPPRTQIAAFEHGPWKVR